MLDEFKSYEKIHNSTVVNRMIMTELDKVKENIARNNENKVHQMALDSKIQNLRNEITQNFRKMSGAEFQKKSQQISFMVKQKDTLTRGHFMSLKTSKVMNRHAALMNESEALLNRMANRELQAVGILQKAKARALNAKDNITVSLIQNEVQVESRKYRDELNNGDTHVATKIAKSVNASAKNTNNPTPKKEVKKQDTKVAAFVKNLSKEERKELVQLLQKDLQTAKVDGKTATVKHTESKDDSKKLNNARGKKPLDAAEVREAGKQAEKEAIAKEERLKELGNDYAKGF